MISNFAARKFEWLDKVCNDRKLTPLAFRVAYKIASFVNRASGYAHPSHQRLANALGVTRRGVQKAIEQLAERGHISIEVAKLEGTANRYRLTQSSWNFDHFKPAEGANAGAQGGANKRAQDSGGGCEPVCAPPANEDAHRVRTGVRPNPFIEPVYRTRVCEPAEAIESTGDGSALQARVSPTMAVSR